MYKLCCLHYTCAESEMFGKQKHVNNNMKGNERRKQCLKIKK